MRRWSRIGAVLLICSACASTSRVATGGDDSVPPSTTQPAPGSTEPAAAADSSVATTASTGVLCSAVPDELPGQVFDDVALDVDGLQGDLGVVDDYVRTHADEVIASEVNRSFSVAQIVVRVRAHADQHAEALRAVVAHPDRLQVRTDHAQSELQSIASQLQTGDTTNYSGVGLARRAVVVDLVPGQETFADELLTQWGDALQITIGGQMYVPAGCGPQPIPERCDDLAGIDPASAGIELKVAADTPSITPGQTGRAKLIVTNIGTTKFSIDSGIPILGVLVTPGSDHVVGTYRGGVAGVGGGVDLAPGGEGSIDVIFGAGRCDGQPGSALPPGTYGLRVALTAEGPPDETRPIYLSSETPITVTT